MPDRDRFDVMAEKIAPQHTCCQPAIATALREECAARDKRIEELEAHVCDHSGCMESFGDPALWERAEKAEAERDAALVEVERKDSALREAAKALMPIISPSDRVKLAAALAEK